MSMRDELEVSELPIKWRLSQVKCEACNLYGHEQDDFHVDPNHEICNDCADFANAQLMSVRGG